MKKPKLKKNRRCSKCGQFGHKAVNHRKRKRNPLVSPWSANLPNALVL